jgi:hypothetical protein
LEDIYERATVPIAIGNTDDTDKKMEKINDEMSYKFHGWGSCELFENEPQIAEIRK